jgi:hypothetical protein
MSQVSNEKPFLLNRAVLFQTDVTSYGVGHVVEVYPDSDRVKVRDEEGGYWKGPMDQITPLEE